MATGLENEQKELAQFIRQGSSRGPQCFGSYFDERADPAPSARSTRGSITCLAITAS